MHIKFLEIQNFRKLKSIRIDIAEETTVFVGANNSGKTSAMVALSHFLVDDSRFTTNDITLSNWTFINKIGERWESIINDPALGPASKNEWIDVLPSMDIWLNITPDKIHYVSHLIPTLQWQGGDLGIRLRLEPKKIDDLFKEYIQARGAAAETVASAKKLTNEEYTLSLWPVNMSEFLARKLNTHFLVRAYTLDPQQLSPPQQGIAKPQTLPLDHDYFESNPLNKLIRIDEINAQRGFSDVNRSSGAMSDADDGEDKGNKRKLSDQLRAYYTKHIDPSEMPEPADVDALQAIQTAQTIFDKKLSSSFGAALEEVGALGYPGFTDLEIILSTKIRPMDGLNHPSALQYKVSSNPEVSDQKYAPMLPEQYNGLGYQNLISMVFRLMSFRDHWMKVGKANKKTGEKKEFNFIEPLHLVLVEEPEAHLHVQVQQVFIRKAYEILRKHPDLGRKTDLTTQLIVTTHSSHIAHECNFSWLRYFRRRPATKQNEVPVSTVVNLSEVFGKGQKTEKFVTQYLQSTHCDLFFADAAILVEGAAERILVPQFIKRHFKALNKSYITILEISGSHAHRLQPLIEHLGLISLIITDIDPAKITGTTKSLVSVPAKRGLNLVTNNFTLRSWIPKMKSLDNLLDVTEDKKILKIDEFSSIRVAYQIPIILSNPTAANVTFEALPNTFEDSLVYTNLNVFPKFNGKKGLLKKFKTTIAAEKDLEKLGDEFFQIIDKGDKAGFALDILYEDSGVLTVPLYISEGLSWLETQIEKKQLEIISETVNALKAEGILPNASAIVTDVNITEKEIVGQ